MGKLNIAHHKSYHPYRLDNIERVRRDEEEAQLREAAEEGRMMLADAEARISLLRERAGIKGTTKRDKVRKGDTDGEIRRAKEEIEKREGTSGAGGLGNGRHINLFEDLEVVSV